MRNLRCTKPGPVPMCCEGGETTPAQPDIYRRQPPLSRDRYASALGTSEKRRRPKVKNSGQWSVVSDRFRFSRYTLGRALFVAFSFLLVAGVSSAQQNKPWEKIPIPPLHEFKPQQPKRIALKHGIVLFLQEYHELPFVSGSV